MSDSVGKKLAQARRKRSLSLDEAAHATKLRPDKILALESDDYGSFPSNAYAKGFLKNYARYLDVDVSAFLSTIDSSLPISVSDYQYLNNAPERPADIRPVRRDRRPPSLIPLVIGAAVLTVVAMGFWIYASAQRIFGEAPVRTRTVAATPATPTTPVPTLPPITPDLAVPAISLEPVPADTAVAEMRPAAPPTTADDRAVLNPAPTTNTPDRDVVTPVAVPTPDPTAAITPASGVNEVLVASLKKTWVTVRKDDPKAPPIFEDFVYPDARPLKLRGARFFIDARDPDAVQITKNGLPVAYQAPGVPIQ